MFTHRIDTRTFCFKSLSLSLSLSQCHTASDNAILIWPRSCLDGTRAPLHTACTTTDPTHIQAESTKDAHCYHVVLLQRSTPISRYILSETQRALDRGVKLWAYLDDWYIWITHQHIPAAIGLASSATRTINLELQPTKIQICAASRTSSIPAGFLDKAKPTLKCLGPSMNTATRSFQNILAIMREPNQAVLKIQTFNDLLTMYVGAPRQHALRTTFVPEAQALSFDSVVAYWS